MSTFEHALSYQFTLFFPPVPRAEWNAVDAIMRAHEALAEASKRDPSLGLRFKPTGQFPIMQTAANGLVFPVQVVQAIAAGNVWRLDFSPLRIDLYFDVQAYREVMLFGGQPPDNVSKDVPLKRVADLVVPPLASLVGKISPVIRLAFVLSGESAVEQPSPQGRVIRRYCAQWVESEPLADLQVRLNRRSPWKLPSLGDIAVNRIETASAAEGLNIATATHKAFSLQLDVNTEPESSREMAPDDVTAFFAEAIAEANVLLEKVSKS